MKVSPSGRSAITAREGRRLLAYQDSVGVWTVGCGHTGRMSPPLVSPGLRITDAECDAYLAADLAPVEAAINALGVPLTQNAFDACASFAFNIGLHGFVHSKVAEYLRAGYMQSAADAFMNWVHPPELRKRREAERKQFLTPDDQPMSKSTMAAMDGVQDALRKEAAGSSHPHKPPAPAAAEPASPPAAEQPKAPTMNPITMFTMAVSLARDVAPYVPHLVSDVKLFTADCEKIIADASKLDATATLADLGKIISDVQTELPIILQVAKASKGLAVA